MVSLPAREKDAVPRNKFSFSSGGNLIARNINVMFEIGYLMTVAVAMVRAVRAGRTRGSGLT